MKEMGLVGEGGGREEKGDGRRERRKDRGAEKGGGDF